MSRTLHVLFLSMLLIVSSSARAQDPDQGIDPHDFYDASNEASDEAFFHLERFFQAGLVGGFGFFTGGLGSSHSAGGAIGFNLIYFLDNLFAIETAFLMTFQNNKTTGVDPAISSKTATTESMTWLFMPNFNLRFYFPTNNMSRFMASMNPYLVGGLDWIIRKQSYQTSFFTDDTATPLNGTSHSESNFGLNIGFGTTSLIYGDFLYIGLDFRFHYMMLAGETDNTVGYSRTGDYFTVLGTLTYDY